MSREPEAQTCKVQPWKVKYEISFFVLVAGIRSKASPRKEKRDIRVERIWPLLQWGIFPRAKWCTYIHTYWPTFDLVARHLLLLLLLLLSSFSSFFIFLLLFLLFLHHYHLLLHNIDLKFNGRILNKPHTHLDAAEYCRRMQIDTNGFFMDFFYQNAKTSILRFPCNVLLANFDRLYCT